MAKSLAAQAAGTEIAPVGDFNVQEAFGEQGGGMQVVPRMNLPYLVFAQPKAEEQFRNLMRHFPDIDDGDPVMIYPEPDKPIRITPLRCTIVAAKQYFEERWEPGKQLKRFAKPILGGAERILAAMLVYHGGKAIPCTCTFKTTRCAAAHAISEEIKKCQEPQWMEQGPEFKQAVAVCALPFCRIVAQIAIAGRTSRTTGLTYKVTKPVLSPSGPAEWQMLADLQKNNISAFKDVATAYNARVAELAIKE